jgi:hypothetical protein
MKKQRKAALNGQRSNEIEAAVDYVRKGRLRLAEVSEDLKKIRRDVEKAVADRSIDLEEASTPTNSSSR